MIPTFAGRSMAATHSFAPRGTPCPTPAHSAIVEMERQDRLVAVVTQNIDGLHQQAGNDADKVIEVHGPMQPGRVLGLRVGGRYGPGPGTGEGGSTPTRGCEECGGILKSATISFGQNLDPETIMRAEVRGHIRRCAAGRGHQPRGLSGGRAGPCWPTATVVSVVSSQSRAHAFRPHRVGGRQGLDQRGPSGSSCRYQRAPSDHF